MSIVGPVALLLRPVPTHGVCLSVRVCTRARVVTFVLSFFFSGGKFISIGEKIRLPDDVTMGYIIGEYCSQNFVLVSWRRRVAAKWYCA